MAASDWDQGHGYQFWRCQHGAYRGDGAFGQFCLVMPAEDAVVVTTAGLGDMQAVLNLVWKHLQPTMKGGRLGRDREAQRRLNRRIQQLAMPTVPGNAASTNSPNSTGRKYVFPPNDQHLEALSRHSEGTTAMVLELRVSGKDQTLPCAFNRWRASRLSWGTFPDRPVAVSGAWRSNDHYEARICFKETPYTLTLSLRFDGNRVTVEPAFNVYFGPAKLPTLVGERPQY